ncbi:MAG: 50S ribosomal protein L9 [Actinobacteria bacterium]|nr:50S ribosomal protein L9 [Actinomycetota bacterium]
MKVILIEDVESVGLMGDVAEVKDGYANNYLIPRKFAVRATPSTLKEIDNLKKTRLKKEAKIREEALAQFARINGLQIVFPVKIGEEGRLFGSITPMDIAEEITKKSGIEVDKRRVELESNIKFLGDYEVPVILFKDVEASVKISVVPEESKKEE